jgi:glycosyltransferase involved in cell wall biosynthesis
MQFQKSLKKEKKICLVIPSLQAGGMERVMSELANHFVQFENCEVHLILYGIKRDVFYEISDRIIIHRPSFKFDNNKRFFHTIKTMLFLRKKMKSLNPDAALSFGEYWNNLVLLSTLGTNIPIFVSDRSQPNKSLGKVQDRLRNWLYPKAKGVIAQTKKAKNIYEKMYHHKNITVIGNPIRPILKSPFTDEGRENIVLMVGRLIASKHQDRLINIFLKINKPDWKLVLVGYDHLKQKHSERLQQIIDENGANERIILAGKQADVEKFYLKSKIFAFTSSSEGFPNVIGEALSAGLPVVSYDCDAGPSDLIEHGRNGFLVPVFDDEGFKIYLDILMSDENKRIEMAKNAILSVAKFSNREIGQKFYRFLTNG